MYEKLSGGVSAAMVLVFDDVQGGQRELLHEPPDHAEWRGYVEATATNTAGMPLMRSQRALMPSGGRNP